MKYSIFKSGEFFEKSKDKADAGATCMILNIRAADEYLATFNKDLTLPVIYKDDIFDKEFYSHLQNVTAGEFLKEEHNRFRHILSDCFRVPLFRVVTEE